MIYRLVINVQKKPSIMDTRGTRKCVRNWRMSIIEGFSLKNREDQKLNRVLMLIPLGHGNEILSSPSHDFEKLMRLFFIIHYSLFSLFF